MCFLHSIFRAREALPSRSHRVGGESVVVDTPDPYFNAAAGASDAVSVPLGTRGGSVWLLVTGTNCRAMVYGWRLRPGIQWFPWPRR